MTRRDFFSRCLAVAGAMLLPAAVVAGIKEETAHLDWMTANAKEGSDVATVQARYCVNGGPWRVVTRKWVKPDCTFWMTPRLGATFQNFWGMA